MLKLRIKKNDIIKKFNVTEDKEQTNIPYLRFKRDYGEYYSNLKLLEGHLISEASNGCFVIDGKVWTVADETIIDDTNVEHIMGIVLTEEGNDSSWIRVNDKLETIEFSPNNLIYKNMQTVNNEFGELVEIPTVYVKTEVFNDGIYEGKTCYWIADYPADGFHIHPAFITEDGKPGVLRIATQWNTYEFTDQEDEEGNRIDTWETGGVRRYSIYDHHILARLMLIEFGTSDIADIIGVKEDPDNEYGDVDHIYHGIHFVFGDDPYYQCEIRGFKIDNTIKVWKSDGSLEYIDTGLNISDDYEFYPLTCFIDKVNGIDMGDIFIAKDNLKDDSIPWDEKVNHNSFHSSQSLSTYSKTYISLNNYPNAFTLNSGYDADESSRLVQVESDEKFNIKEEPSKIIISENYLIPFEQVDLPDKIEVVLEDDSTKEVQLAWNGDNYDPISPGTQTVEGEILLSGKVSNDEGYKVVADVTVGEEPDQSLKDLYFYCEKNIDHDNDSEHENMTYIPKENIVDLTNIKAAPNASNAFSYCHYLIKFPEHLFDDWDTSEITDMSYMFCGCNSAKNIDIGNFNTSEVTNMEYMFSGCYTLINLDTSNWDLGKVTSMYRMFNGCTALRDIQGIENWDTKNVTDISDMFYDCGVFKKADRKLNLSNWDVSNVTKMQTTFYRCYQLTELDTTGWNTHNLKNMVATFWDCGALKEIKGIEDWDTSNLEKMEGTFRNCYGFESLDLSKWNTSKLKILGEAFNNCTNLREIKGIENWDVSSVTDLGSPFNGCINFHADLSNWDVRNVTGINYLFAGYLIDNLTGWANWNTSSLRGMEGAFSAYLDYNTLEDNTHTKTIDLSGWDLSNVDCIRFLCQSRVELENLILPEVNFFNNGKLKLMDRAFFNCQSLPTVFPYVIDCSSVYYYGDMSGLFGCSSVREVTLKGCSPSVKNDLQNDVKKIGHNSEKDDGFIIHFID